MDLLKELVIKTQEDVGEIRKDIGEIKKDLAFHIARTNQLEDRADLLENHFTDSREDIKKLLKQMNMAHGAIALIGLLAAIAGIIKSLN